MRAFACVLVAGCTVGAPPGFSGGDHWVFPLVGPLEDGLLITPVTVRGHGPYLFAIDPDANVTAIDQKVAVEAQLLVGSGPRRIDESETGRARFYAELRDLKISGLTIDRRDVMVFPNRTYDTEGRQINGILGRDVIADSLVFGFDRDQGIATLSTVKSFQAPPDAIAIKYAVVSSRSSDFVASTAVPGRERSAGDPFPTGSSAAGPALDPTKVSPAARPIRTAKDVSRIERNNFEYQQASARQRDPGAVVPVPRRLSRTQIGNGQFAMHLDLGAVTSQLPESKWGAAGLASGDAKVRLVDEAASVRVVDKAATASEVALGGAKAAGVAFVPFVDKRWKTEGVEGTLGLDFFQPYAVYANWDSGTYYLKPRGDAAALTMARLGRWGSRLPACQQLGCITPTLITTGESVVLQVVRDEQAVNRPLEVFLGVTSAAGKPMAPLVVELPAGADQLTTAVPPEYAGATLVVLDASPFPRPCVGDRGCVAMLGGPLAGNAELSPQTTPGRAASGPAGAPSPASVALEKLHRVTGDPAIAPSAEVLSAAAGKPLGAAIVRLCVSPEGKVETTKMVKSSGVVAYDQQLQSTIKETWTFEPLEVDGQPASLCTSATFVEASRAR